MSSAPSPEKVEGTGVAPTSSASRLMAGILVAFVKLQAPVFGRFNRFFYAWLKDNVTVQKFLFVVIVPTF